MDRQEFTLQAGGLTGKVTGNEEGRFITISFAVDGAEKPVASHEEALLQRNAIKEKILAVAPDCTIDEPTVNDKGKVGLVVSFKHSADYSAVLDMLPMLELPALRPADMPGPVVQDEKNGPQTFLQRLMQAEVSSNIADSSRIWKLSGETSGISAIVFPTQKSSLTGDPQDRETNLIAIRITPGIDTTDARNEIYRITSEIENRLKGRLPVQSSMIYLGTKSDGHSDTGVIILNAGPDAEENLKRVNQVLYSLQAEYDVFNSKLGTGRARLLPREQPDPIEAAINQHLKDAVDSGLLGLSGAPRQLNEWTQKLVAEIRNIQQQQSQTGS